MKLIKIENEMYEVRPCLHCKKDNVEYSPAYEPWSAEKWICDFCGSTYVVFNTDIAENVTLREEREEKLKNII